MNTNIASVKLSFDRTAGDLLSLKLRVSYQRTQRRYSFPLKSAVLLSNKDFDRLVKYHETRNERVAEEIRLLYAKIRPFIDKAEKLCTEIQPFSFDEFKSRFYKAEQESNVDELDLLVALELKAKSMLDAGQVGNGNNYTSTSRSLKRFVQSLSPEELKELSLPVTGGSLSVPITSVNSDFLNLYEQWMSHFGKAPKKKKGEATPASSTTVSMYVRCVRTLFNDAIDSGLIPRDQYPFGRRRYVIPAAKSAKRALSKDDILKIMAYECQPETFEARSRDFWMMSYLSNGMNFTDLLNLKWRDVDLASETIIFTRQKTGRTKKADQKQIKVGLFPQSMQIIQTYSVPGMPKDYVFPYLSNEQTPAKQKATITQFIKVTNRHMRNIADKLGINGNVNTYSARHSFSTILLHSEAPLAFISEALGHSSIKTTQNYLGSFEDKKVREYLKALI